MYKCITCGKEYAMQPNQCECNGKAFEVIIGESVSQKEQSVTVDIRISGSISNRVGYLLDDYLDSKKLSINEER